MFSGYSAYQKVDILEAPDGKRYLYLDGLQHFGSADGSRLNVLMGQVPASLIQPRSALVFGAGSMEMAKFIAESAGNVTTVEIDPMVVDASLRFLTQYNLMDRLANRTIVIDDAKNFIANTDQHFDLIATDLPAAYAMQTATLYSVPFYRTIAEHLNAKGLLVANLTSTFGPQSLVSRRITASLLEVYDQVIVVTSPSAGWSFAYASNELPFDATLLEAALHKHGETQFIIYDTPAVRFIVDNAKPITLDTMDIVLQISTDWIKNHLSWR